MEVHNERDRQRAQMVDPRQPDREGWGHAGNVGKRDWLTTLFWVFIADRRSLRSRLCPDSPKAEPP